MKRPARKYKAEHIGTLPDDVEISIYRQGEWLDLCTGPHLPSTGKLGNAFKLTAGFRRLLARRCQECPAPAHLRAPAGKRKSSSRPTCTMVEEAEKRDHRRLGKRDEPLPSPGRGGRQRSSGTPRAGTLWRTVEALCAPPPGRRADYVEVKTPQLIDRGALGGLGPLGEVPRAHVHCGESTRTGSWRSSL